MKTFITACFLPILLQIIALPILQAQSEAWERINPKPVEASLYDCSLLPNNRIVAVGSNATVMYTDNFGDDWEIIYTPDNIVNWVDFVSVDFADELHGMAVGSYFSMIRTDDGGATWTDISPGANLPYYDYTDVCFRDPSNCFVIGQLWNCFLLHSSDGGASWDTIFQTNGDTFRQIQFVDENTGFLGNSGGDYFFKSTDGGINWEKITVIPTIEDLHAGVIHFISTETGFIGAGVGDATGYDEIILKTVDGGHSWYQVFMDPFAGAKGFFFLDQDTGFAFSPMIFYTNQVMKTTDGGESWNKVNEHLGYFYLEGLCMNNEGVGLIVGDEGQIYKSIDFGNSWNDAFTNICPGLNIDKTFIINDSTILANVTGGTGGVTAIGTIESNDRGTTWSGAQFEYGISAIYYVNDLIVFYSGFYPYTDAGIYKSTNGGTSWEFYALGEGEFQPYSIEFIDDQTGFVAGTSDGYGLEMFRTEDQGETWVQVISDCFHTVDDYSPIELEFKDDSTGFIVGEIWSNSPCNILTSHDRGITWEIDTLPYTYNFDGILFLNSDTGFLYGYQNLLKTVNGGQTWYPVTVNPGNQVYLHSMSFPTSQTGYGLNESLSLFSILKTEDGGETWNSLEAPTSANLNSINFFTEDEGLIFGVNGLIFKTQTGGLVGVPDPGVNPKIESMWQCYPNPFSSNMNISPLKDISGKINMRIFDFTGRPVRYHTGSSATAGETFFNWDGREDQGNEVAPGIYLVMISSNSMKETMKVIKF